MLHTLPKKHLVAAGLLGALIGAGLFLSSSENVEAQRISVPLLLKTQQASTSPAEEALRVATQSLAGPTATANIPISQQPAETSALQWHEYQVRSGDSLSTLFHRAGFDDSLMFSVLNGKGDSKALADLYVGEKIAFGLDDQRHLAGIRLTKSRLSRIEVTREGDHYETRKIVRQPEVHVAFADGVIQDSLFVAGQKAGLSDRLTMELAGIFGWDIDFVNDIRQGDRFDVVYEQLYLDGEKIGNGRILAASFTNQGDEYQAVLYTDASGESEYYTPDGKSMRKAFLRTPVAFTRISSPFNMHRRHPILHHLRKHEGTDFAAPSGTPIKASGDGKIIFAGRRGGYGNMVIIAHGQGITTRYGHMRSFARRTHIGKHVSQGQVIGYVGQTGLATGPHLHYEFRANGAPRNPVTVHLPDANPISRKERASFDAQTTKLLSQLNTFEATTRIALTQPGKEAL